MRRILKRITWVLSILLGLLLTSIFVVLLIDNQNTKYLKISAQDSWKQQSYAITNVQVIPMTQDTILEHKTVVIKQGIIHSIEDHFISDSIPIIDAEGGYLTPGLIDMHVHVWDRYELGLYLANGVTTIRNMWGLPMHLTMKDAINNGTLMGPNFYTASPKLTGPDDAGLDKVQLSSPEDARAHIKTYKEAGYDLIKTYAGMPEPIFDAVIAQAQEEGLRIGAHPSHEVAYDYHFKSIFETVEHTEDILQTALEFDLDSTKIKAVVALYASHQKPHTPTLTIFQNIIDIMENQDILDSEMTRYVNPGFIQLGAMDTYNRWTSELQYNPEILERFRTQHQNHLKLVKLLHEAGVPLVCGSDSGIMFATAGFSTHEELRYYLEAGLSPFEALSTATVNPSQVATMYENYGTIETGKVANLILTSNNPLKDLSLLQTPKKLWIQGRMLNANTLEEFKQKAQDRSNGIATILRFLESLM